MNFWSVSSYLSRYLCTPVCKHVGRLCSIVPLIMKNFTLHPKRGGDGGWKARLSHHKIFFFLTQRLELSCAVIQAQLMNHFAIYTIGTYLGRKMPHMCVQCIHNAQAHTSTAYYEHSIHYVLCLLQLLRSALYHFVKVKMSKIVSSNSFHYFKNQFFQEEVPISEKMKCYDVALWPLLKKKKSWNKIFCLSRNSF